MPMAQFGQERPNGLSFLEGRFRIKMRTFAGHGVDGEK